MNFDLLPLKDEHLGKFKCDMQEAFQLGACEGLGQTDEQILPEGDIDNSLNTAGACAYEALVDGKLVGGAIVVINSDSQHNHLDFLYVKSGIHYKGIGKLIWDSIEKLYPQTKVWETCTPYFEKRNIHFYVNKCGFHVVEFYNKFHQDPNDKEEIENGEDDKDYCEMFRFEKVMN